MKCAYANSDKKDTFHSGKKVWLNFLNRNLLHSSTFKRSIEDREFTGILFNAPAMAQSIARDEEYQNEISKPLRSQTELDDIYLSLAIEDVKAAADLFLPVFEETKGRDGFVGIDVSPEYAYDVDALIEEANTLWQKTGRSNIMIQLPATEEALPAYKELLQSGVNVNATLLCSLSRYRDIARAHIEGMADRLEKGFPVEGIASAVTFSVPCPLEQNQVPADPHGEADLLREICISTVPLARKAHYDAFHKKEFQELAAKGVQPQFLLCIDEAETAHAFGNFCCARDLTAESNESASCDLSVGESGPPELISISEDQHGDIEKHLDMLQEEFIKSQVVQIDRALMILKDRQWISLR
jgi:transaldolase/transaldolase/glucose-6-phosphate isomerase